MRYIKINDEDENQLVAFMESNNIEHTVKDDALYFTVEQRMNELMKNNLVPDKDITEENIKYIYNEINPLDIDIEIKELLYALSKEDLNGED